jgi:pantothenate kinase type III
MRSGIFWGAVGAIRQLVTELGAHEAAAKPPGKEPAAGPRRPDKRFADRLQESDPIQVFLTGGGGPALAGLLGPAATHVPHLTLAGIALAADYQQRR